MNEVEEIKARNKKVEADKAWETSWLRRLSIALFTYIIAAIYMNYIGLQNPFLGAFIPTGGYLLSTLSLPFVKNYWITKLYKNRNLK